jgi:hypothetical protein
MSSVSAAPNWSPPSALDAVEARAWRAIVDASPSGYLDGTAQLILRQVVTQVAVADRHSQRLRSLAAQPEDHFEAEVEVARAHREAMVYDRSFRRNNQTWTGN